MSRDDSKPMSVRHLLFALASAAGLFLAGGVILLWGWNTFVSELFAVPEMAFRHALALELMIVLVVAIPAVALRMLGHHPHAVR